MTIKILPKKRGDRSHDCAKPRKKGAPKRPNK
jgi:hypothetical protein